MGITLKLGGKIYKQIAIKKTKAAAKQVAAKKRKQGLQARVTPFAEHTEGKHVKGHGVWIRRK